MVDEPKELDSSSDSQTQDELDLEIDQEAPTSSADSETEEDLLSVVQSAMEIEEPEEAESQSEEEVEGEDDGDAESLAASDDADEDVSDKSPVPYKRFQEVIAEKNEFKHGADQFNKITDYLSHNNINADEASTGLQIMALMKNDPAKALEALTPFVNTLRELTGEVLPSDIRNKVDDGFMDEDAGRELSRARAEADNQKRINDRVLTQQNNAQSEQHKNHLARTVTAWEDNARQSDPDYDLKQDEIDDRVRVLVSERGSPNTEEDAISMANEAYESVNQRFKARMGTKRAIRTASGGKLGGTPVAEPKSLLEAVQNAVAAGSS